MTLENSNCAVLLFFPFLRNCTIRGREYIVPFLDDAWLIEFVTVNCNCNAQQAKLKVRGMPAPADLEVGSFRKDCLPTYSISRLQAGENGS